MRDIVFEAAFLRDALLVGLVHEREVPEWAAELLAIDVAPAGALVELLSVPVQLSPIRDALRAFGEVEVSSRVTGALLTSAALAPTHHWSGDGHLLRVLSDIRRLAGCPDVWAGAIADFEAQALLAAAGRRPSAPTTREILSWLNIVRPPGHFLVTCGDRRLAAVFVAALSRATAAIANGPGEVTFEGVVNNAWIVGLDEAAWSVARDRVGPLAVASMVPYPGTLRGSRLLDHASVQGADVEMIETRLAAFSASS